MSDEYIDKNVKAVVDKMKSRMEFGFQKYGVTTERTDLNREQFLTHLEEELMDSLMYIQAIKNNKFNLTDYEILYDFVHYIANDYFELSSEKLEIQRNDYVRTAKHIMATLQKKLYTNI